MYNAFALGERLSGTLLPRDITFAGHRVRIEECKWSLKPLIQVDNDGLESYLVSGTETKSLLVGMLHNVFVFFTEHT